MTRLSLHSNGLDAYLEALKIKYSQEVESIKSNQEISFEDRSKQLAQLKLKFKNDCRSAKRNLFAAM